MILFYKLFIIILLLRLLVLLLLAFIYLLFSQYAYFMSTKAVNMELCFRKRFCHTWTFCIQKI